MFMPDGGSLGYRCENLYLVSNANLEISSNCLRGRDAAFLSAARNLGLEGDIIALWDASSGQALQFPYSERSNRGEGTVWRFLTELNLSESDDDSDEESKDSVQTADDVDDEHQVLNKAEAIGGESDNCEIKDGIVKDVVEDDSNSNSNHAEHINYGEDGDNDVHVFPSDYQHYEAAAILITIPAAGDRDVLKNKAVKSWSHIGAE